MYKINPHKGVDEICFGMRSEEIQERLKKVPVKVQKWDDEYASDMFDCFFVYYRNPGVCEAIEFFNSPELEYEGMKFFEKKYPEVKKWFLERDSEIEEDDTGLTSYKLGIGVYSPNKSIDISTDEDEAGRIESVIVFEDGYYE